MGNQQANKEIATFNFHNQPVRIVTINGEPWFVAKDVCDALKLTNSRKAISSLDTDEKDVTSSYTLGGKQALSIISESGMYAIVLRTRKAMQQGTPEHSFRKWVTSEVLPTIRKTGNYNTSAEAPTPMSVSNADWTRYIKVLTIPEMATLTGHDEKSVISGLYHATHSSDARTTKQPILPNPPPQVQTVLDQFWDTVSQLDLQQINHSRDPQVLAISLPELYNQAGEQLPKRRSMLTALKHSLIPKFKDSNHPINSTITGNTKKCWVFVMPNAQQ